MKWTPVFICLKKRKLILQYKRLEKQVTLIGWCNLGNIIFCQKGLSNSNAEIFFQSALCTKSFLDGPQPILDLKVFCFVFDQICKNRKFTFCVFGLSLLTAPVHLIKWIFESNWKLSCHHAHHCCVFNCWCFFVVDFYAEKRKNIFTNKWMQSTVWSCLKQKLREHWGPRYLHVC